MINKLQQEFDAANPEVWRLFCKFAFEAIAAGRVDLSASLVVERIRWETEVVTRGADDFKVNNNHRAYYARKFNRAFPYAGGKFVTRAVTGEPIETFTLAYS